MQATKKTMVKHEAKAGTEDETTRVELTTTTTTTKTKPRQQHHTPPAADKVELPNDAFRKESDATGATVVRLVWPGFAPGEFANARGRGNGVTPPGSLSAPKGVAVICSQASIGFHLCLPTRTCRIQRR
jgi:hypothetical protein